MTITRVHAAHADTLRRELLIFYITIHNTQSSEHSPSRVLSDRGRGEGTDRHRQGGTDIGKEGHSEAGRDRGGEARLTTEIRTERVR